MKYHYSGKTFIVQYACSDKSMFYWKRFTTVKNHERFPLQMFYLVYGVHYIHFASYIIAIATISIANYSYKATYIPADGQLKLIAN